MTFEHDFKYSKKEIFEVLKSSILKEIEYFTKSIPNDLTNFSYMQNRGKYSTECLIKHCDIELGYSTVFKESTNSNYNLEINFIELNENECKIIYVNNFNSTSSIKKLNYQIASFIFKKRIKNKFIKLTEYLEQSLENTNF